MTLRDSFPLRRLDDSRTSTSRYASTSIPDNWLAPSGASQPIFMLHKTTSERISEMLNLVHSKGEQYIQQNPYSEYQEIAYKAKLSGLIRKKTDEEIAENERMWKEENDENITTPTNASGEMRGAGVSGAGIEADIAGAEDTPPEEEGGDITVGQGDAAAPDPAAGGAPDTPPA